MSEAEIGIDSDILLLYELSLCIGHNLDLTDNCKAFTEVLMTRKGLDYAAVWIASNQLYSESSNQYYELIHAVPEVRAATFKLDNKHPSFQFEANQDSRCICAGDDGFEDVIAETGIEDGGYALFKLKDIGLLKLHRSNNRCFSQRELNQLQTVIDKFATTLSGALSHLSLLVESTRRKATQVSLQHQKALLRSLIDSVPDLIFYKDQDSVYLGCNRAFEVFANHRESEIIGRTDFDFFDQESAEFFRDKDRKMMASGAATRNEEWVTYPDGKRVLLDTLKTPFYGPDNDLLGLIGISRDITDIKTTQQALQRAQKMEAIGQLTGGIAHDFNNILGIIMGNVNLLTRDGMLTDKMMKRVLAVDQSARRAADLTKQLLGFSRQQPTRSINCDLNQRIAEMDSLIMRSVTPVIEVVQDLYEDLWHCKIDPGDFQDTLLNLVLNARDAMPEGGQLSITSRNATLSSKDVRKRPDIKPGEYVQIEVRDTGVGIEENTLDRIFEPFFTTKSQGKGTGLGLSMAYGFVSRSDGHISADSSPGQGTCFTIFLPRSKEKMLPHSDEQDSDDQLPHGNESVLVVDDETMLLNVAEDMLNTLGYSVLQAEDGSSALDKLQAHPEIRLLFTDVVMPGGMNGFELARRASQQYPDLKVLLTTGYAEREVPGSKASPFRENVLSKPYDLVELATRVRNTLDNAMPAVGRAP